MAFKIIFIEEFGKAFVPKKFRPNLKSYLMKAGYAEVPYKFFGVLFYFSALVTAITFTFLLYPFIKGLGSITFFLASFFGWFLTQITLSLVSILLIYFYLDLKIYQRTKKMEEQLPDFLELLSANLKGGMTFEKALWSSIKPRFTILSVEMGKAAKQVMTGYEVTKALLDLSEKYDSLMLRRTVDLIISEVDSGGNIADLIDRIVDNLKETKELKDEMTTAAISYVIFISVIVIVISPLLFALAFHLLLIILNFVNKISQTTSKISSLPFTFKKSEVNANDFKTFSMVTIFTISLFSSLIVSIVEKGDIKGGIKYIPFYVIFSMSFYLLFMKILGTLFSGLLA